MAQIVSSDRIGKLILKDLAELDRRRAEMVLDSISYNFLDSAYHAESQSLDHAKGAIMELEGQKNDYQQLSIIQEEEYNRMRKELKNQTRLKWFALGIAAVVAVLSLN